ncbi:sulfurtransferase [Komarekiella sp. 'clone 1']|uniref:Sulfurtransferase n=1 Tax=Komarekiella delphini-convector SJRDD-AB1 TaxID=2593771 RepID=A0AA40VPW9_9NOST|nr:sulfurtransferase [Komarekiella delphini-convector]MBD6615182.1 sulfurtransferase [Komarekiella delphini-convector SJRDD-AB1]
MFSYVHPEVIVDTQWIADHLSDPKVRLVEGDLSSQLYNVGHIPGAVFWNLFTDIMRPDGQINFDTDVWERLLERSGIANDTTVIVYGDLPATGAWIFWLLKVLGHQDVRVLNGGRRKWIAEGRPLTTEQPIVTPTQYRVQNPDASLRAPHKDVLESIKRTDRVLVDVRSPQEYSGEWFYNKPPEATERTGHIPSATHVYYELALNDDGTFKPINELQALYGGKDITADKEVITYCAVGARSGHTWFVLKYLLGYPHVRNYDGSWNEWSQLPDTPIEK